MPNKFAGVELHNLTQTPIETPNLESNQLKSFLFNQVSPHRARLRLPLEPDVPRAADPPHRHRQRKGRRQGVPESGCAGHPG